MFQIDIAYNSSTDTLVFNHSDAQNIPPKQFNFQSLRYSVSGSILVNFLHDDHLFLESRDILDLYVLLSDNSRIMVKLLDRKETKTTRVQNPEGIPDRTIIEEITFYNYYLVDFKTTSCRLLETTTENISNNDGSLGAYHFKTEMFTSLTTKHSDKEFDIVSFSTDSYLGRAICNHFLASNYKLVSIRDALLCNGVSNYKIFIPKSDFLGKTFLWYLRSKKLITDPVCLKQGVRDVVEHFIKRLYQETFSVPTDLNPARKLLAEDYQKTTYVALTDEEEKIYASCQKDAKKVLELILSEFGPMWLDSQYRTYKTGVINYYDSEVRQPECKTMYNNALVALQQAGVFVPKWKQEFELYLLLLSYFPDAEFQYTVEWLGLQSLDVYVPSLNIAFEYQGVQHSKPVEHFGGEEHFKETVERDTRKKALCEENNVQLLYWNYNEAVTADMLGSKLMGLGIVLPDKKASPDIVLGLPNKPTASANTERLKVFQYNQKFELSGTFNTISEASKSAGVSSTSIGKALHGERLLAGGYFWYRGHEPLPEIPEKWRNHMNN